MNSPFLAIVGSILESNKLADIAVASMGRFAAPVCNHMKISLSALLRPLHVRLYAATPNTYAVYSMEYLVKLEIHTYKKRIQLE